MGGFDEWARTVGSILAHAGIEGFLSNLGRLYEEADEEEGQWEAFLDALKWRSRGATFSVADVHEWLLERVNGLWAALPDDILETAGADAPGFRARLGIAFRKRADTPYGQDELRLERAGDDSHRKVRLWWVRGMREMREMVTSFAPTKVPFLRVVGTGGGTEGEGANPSPHTPHPPRAGTAAAVGHWRPGIDGECLWEWRAERPVLIGAGYTWQAVRKAS